MTPLLARPRFLDHPFISGASPDFIREIGPFQNEIEFAAGEVLLRERHYANKFYLILEGDVTIAVETGRELPLVIQTLGPGEVLGWSWFYPPYVWHFTARAISSGKAVVFNAPALLVHAEDNPKFGFELMKRLTMHVIKRLQKTTELIGMDERLQHSAEPRYPVFSQRLAFPDRTWVCHHNKE